MEIDDGGAVAAEFSSEYESDGNNSYQNNEESSESQHSFNEETDAESGEIDNSDRETDCKQNLDCNQTNWNHPKPKRRRRRNCLGLV